MSNIILPRWNQQLLECDSCPEAEEAKEPGTIESTLDIEFIKGYIGSGDVCFPIYYPSTAQAIDLLGMWCGQPM